MRRTAKRVHPLPAVGALLAILVAFGALATPQGVEAQWWDCWECGVVYWPGDDCDMGSCVIADVAGEAHCSQYGGCGDLDTCNAHGPGCQPALVLLDGRSGPAMNDAQADALLGDTSSGSDSKFTRSREGDAEYLRLSCNGIVIHAWYSPSRVRLLRERTSRLVL